MHKTILAIAAVGSVFAISAAGASGWSLVSGGGPTKATSVGSTTFTLAQCQDTFTLAYTVDEHAGSEASISTVVATGVEDAASASCAASSTLKFYADGTTTNPLATSTGAYVGSTGDNVITFTFAEPNLLTDGTAIDVVMNIAETAAA